MEKEEAKKEVHEQSDIGRTQTNLIWEKRKVEERAGGCIIYDKDLYNQSLRTKFLTEAIETALLLVAGSLIGSLITWTLMVI